MKKIDLLDEILPVETLEIIDSLRSQLRRRPLPLQLFLILCLNLLLAPAVYAAATVEISRGQAFAIAMLGLVTLGLSVYLFSVIFQPERF